MLEVQDSNMPDFYTTGDIEMPVDEWPRPVDTEMSDDVERADEVDMESYESLHSRMAYEEPTHDNSPVIRDEEVLDAQDLSVTPSLHSDEPSPAIFEAITLPHRVDGNQAFQTNEGTHDLNPKHPAPSGEFTSGHEGDGYLHEPATEHESLVHTQEQEPHNLSDEKHIGDEFPTQKEVYSDDLRGESPQEQLDHPAAHPQRLASSEYPLGDHEQIQTNFLYEEEYHESTPGTPVDAAEERHLQHTFDETEEAPVQEEDPSSEVEPPPSIQLTFPGVNTLFYLFKLPDIGNTSPYLEASNSGSHNLVLFQNRPSLCRGPLSDLFDALRAETQFVDLVGDDELEAHFVDLGLTINEDNRYALEVSIADLDILHAGKQIDGPLKLSLVLNTKRFITQYRRMMEQVHRDVEASDHEEQDKDERDESKSTNELSDELHEHSQPPLHQDDIHTVDTAVQVNDKGEVAEQRRSAPLLGNHIEEKEVQETEASGAKYILSEDDIYVKRGQQVHSTSDTLTAEAHASSRFSLDITNEAVHINTNGSSRVTTASVTPVSPSPPNPTNVEEQTGPYPNVEDAIKEEYPGISPNASSDEAGLPSRSDKQPTAKAKRHFDDLDDHEFQVTTQNEPITDPHGVPKRVRTG